MQNLELLSERVARVNLEHRRNKEAERKERIFNDKVRTIGVDKEALDMQVEEKKRQAAAAKEQQRAYEADMLHHSKVASILQSRQVKERRAVEKALVAYRDPHQQLRNRREFDLNDQGDAGMTLPPLVGEDPKRESRLQRQKEQLGEWLFQQQTENAAGRHQKKLEDQLYDQSRVEMDNKAAERQRLEMERRRAIQIATDDYNLAMAKEKQRKQEECNKDMVGVPVLRPSSVRAPKESLQHVIEFQKYQMEENKRTKLLERQEEDCYDRSRLQSDHTARLIERQQARLNKQLRQHQDSTNVQLAHEHKQQKPDIERGLVDDRFFSQFNTSSR
ncbi:RIB43A-like with coiled-coils protein 2 [Cololabis saira]|uniref:RIB43A-like with coiled-coils protein 2 n=1 Tax=Cololabis saira TaxID=129043 RepID=UPI002AD3AB35|nr:RIB43A-like with coiled-coils protein 2 [Cololabis saira]